MASSYKDAGTQEVKWFLVLFHFLSLDHLCSFLVFNLGLLMVAVVAEF